MKTPYAHPFDTSHEISISNPDYQALLLQLLRFSQTLCGQTDGVLDRFCREVALVTHGQARLLLRSWGALESPQESSPSIEISFPVQFRDILYGKLVVVPDPDHPPFPALPFDIAHLLAQTCGFLLYLLEMSVFVQGQVQRFGAHPPERLTKREREVLTLMWRGYDQRAIATALNITRATVNKHQQHIYARLGVHCERDALLAAYHAGLFSPLEDLPT
jgi:DNA-binding CsgD family transcriptional regulator